MPRYRLTIAYDGTNFCGWQKQTPPEEHALAEHVLAAEGGAGVLADEPGETDAASSDDRARVELRTVQAVVERAVRAAVREPVVVMGASRTDSGVHARGQVAAFTCSGENAVERGVGWPSSRGAEALMRAINSRLPADVLVVDAAETAADFNPIQGAKSKRYTYTIWNAPTRPLWERTTALHIWSPLDVERMSAAARIIVGEHDFAAFAAAGHGRLSTVRTVFACEVHRGSGASPGMGPGGAPKDSVHVLAPMHPLDPRIVISVTGNGFLWNMVRIIAGTLVEVGRGRMDVARVEEALRTGRRELAGPTLQPQGLCLEWIRYE